jgi:hypothetical protein
LFNIQMPGIIAAIAVTGLQKTGPSGPVSWVLVNARRLLGCHYCSPSIYF